MGTLLKLVLRGIFVFEYGPQFPVLCPVEFRANTTKLFLFTLNFVIVQCRIKSNC